ncbi:EAL domain-containing protein [Planctomicrobium piriforme]|uniref:EAL domain, c-di-GMP-specific phosphodiesterase class I (Or its enzymatically inactive variant) n=1 Tax=Planctomicrobium piriforme TaxID=1576369 RepID=A0A1I3NCT4_9PLAN|nr:EAL domain-containing protein [Planctomicrobium piriforme]SFJ07151.1 EAL domain, c-di-GMP-specific phosphodiesterase class I (or its enzymatically inactive variant) [Planctomicrobium piriforme]
MAIQTLVSPPGAPAASKTRDGWYLIGCLPPLRTLTQIKVDSPAFVIGRRPESDLQIASQCISARHAEILQIGPHLFLRDLGSTNGTYLNRRQVKQPTPIADGDHIEIANVEFRVEYRAAAQRGSRADLDALKKTTQAVDVLESNWVLSQLSQLMQGAEIVPAYQPIIDLSNGLSIGYEALARTALIGLENPAEMFRTAEMVNREVELSLICRRKAAECGTFIPGGMSLFVNTHSNESLDVDVLPSLAEMRRRFPQRSVVVEIHEGAINNPHLTADFCKAVRDLGYKVAYDDFGAGQSRLLELVKAPPDYLKFDACLIRDIHESNPYQWRMLKMLVDMCHDVPIVTIAEGVESEEEKNACRELGFDMGQGYFFGRPKPASGYVPQSESPTRKFG